MEGAPVGKGWPTFQCTATAELLGGKSMSKIGHIPEAAARARLPRPSLSGLGRAKQDLRIPNRMQVSGGGTCEGRGCPDSARPDPHAVRPRQRRSQVPPPLSPLTQLLLLMLLILLKGFQMIEEAFL